MPLPVFTNDQIADQLVRGSWEHDGGIPVYWDKSVVLVSLGDLTTSGQTLARAALQVWSDVTGISFFESMRPTADIVFDDNQPGAYASFSYDGDGALTHADVNVSTAWLRAYGTALDTYSFQTYVHEIGHALGLGHAGNYNGSADYATDALFENDSWQTTVMSYFSQDDNTSVEASYAFVVTPQVADVVAMQPIYDFAVSTRAGDTVYGFNATAGNVLFDATVFSGVAYTVVDSGGRDTFDYSGFSADQIVDLRQEAFSSVGGLIENVAIGRGAVIENAITGAGDDLLIGNSAVNVLAGGAGDDVYVVQTVGDQAIEANVAGVDRVESSVSYSLAGQYVEALTLTGAAAINGTGNSLANTIVGNGARNVIDGGKGSDTMSGGGGDDDYVVASAGDRVIELDGEGTDRVLSSVSYSLAGQYVERLRLTGSADVNATGNSLNNAIAGNTGDNVIDGGKGADRMAGGGGSDVFAFTTRLGTVDVITDFDAPSDTIRLENAIFVGLSTGALAESAFALGSTAQDLADRILYDQGTGGLFYDRDGTGSAYAAVRFATLENRAAIAAEDFAVV